MSATPLSDADMLVMTVRSLALQLMVVSQLYPDETVRVTSKSMALAALALANQCEDNGK